MSRIGRLPIDVPAGVTVTIDGQAVAVKGPKGELSLTVKSPIEVKLEEGLALMIDWIKEQGPRPFQHHLKLEIDRPSAPITWSQKLL